MSAQLHHIFRFWSLIRKIVGVTSHYSTLKIPLKAPRVVRYAFLIKYTFFGSGMLFKPGRAGLDWSEAECSENCVENINGINKKFFKS